MAPAGFLQISEIKPPPCRSSRPASSSSSNTVRTTAGEAPALTRLLREIIERILPEKNYVEAARALRARWKRDRVPMKSRFPELLEELTAKIP